jgi:hypothetical protein
VSLALIGGLGNRRDEPEPLGRIPVATYGGGIGSGLAKTTGEMSRQRSLGNEKLRKLRAVGVVTDALGVELPVHRWGI